MGFHPTNSHTNYKAHKWHSPLRPTRNTNIPQEHLRINTFCNEKILCKNTIEYYCDNDAIVLELQKPFGRRKSLFCSVQKDQILVWVLSCTELFEHLLACSVALQEMQHFYREHRATEEWLLCCSYIVRNGCSTLVCEKQNYFSLFTFSLLKVMHFVWLKPFCDCI